MQGGQRRFAFDSKPQPPSEKMIRKHEGKVLPFQRKSVWLADTTDEVLVAACALRDPGAMAELFDRHCDAVHRFLARLLGAGASDLDDMVHTTFLEALRSAARFRGGSSVRTWLFGIAANVGRHHIRDQVRRRSFLRAWGDIKPSPSQSPDLAAEHHQMAERVAAAVAQLPFNLRAAFVLCDLEEMSGADAAAALDVRRGTLGRRLFEARRALRAAVEEAQP
jgi:RNA polymerase sigma-70 factor (ECF subfamily)